MGDEKVLKEIGKRINFQRKQLGITQEALAEKMDVSVQMISNLELGKKAIRPENLIKLCNALKTSSDFILMGTRSEAEISFFTQKFSKLSATDQAIVEELTDRLIMLNK